MPRFKASVTASKVRRAQLIPIRHSSTPFKIMADAAANWSEEEQARLGPIKEADDEINDEEVNQELEALRRETLRYRADMARELMENGEVIGLPAVSPTARGPWPGPPSPTSSDIFGPSSSHTPGRTPSPWADKNAIAEPTTVTEPTALTNADDTLTLEEYLQASHLNASAPIAVASQPLPTAEFGPIGGPVGPVGPAVNPETDSPVNHDMYHDPMGLVEDPSYLGHPDITDLCLDSEFDAQFDPSIPLPMPIGYPVVSQNAPVQQSWVVEDMINRDRFVWHPPRCMAATQPPLQPEQVSTEPRSPYIPKINWDLAPGCRTSTGPLHQRQIRGFSPLEAFPSNATSSPKKRRRTENTPEPDAPSDPYDFKIWEDPEEEDPLDPSWGADGTL